jgi:2',3'-cyclic-nucleotide 2'-phosphodiesterase (5'-nucleotidase family)
MMMKTMTIKWEQRLSANNQNLDEIDSFIRDYNSRRIGASEEELKKPETQYELSNLANNVTKAATSHALKGKKHLWPLAKDYSKKSKSHKETAKQLEYGTQDSLF